MAPSGKLVIVPDAARIESFLADNRIAFDEVFVPDSVNWSGVRSALEEHLAAGRASEFEGATEADFACVRGQLEEYRKEFGGYRHLGRDYLVCNMHMYGKEDEGIAEMLGAPADDSPDFTCVMDGGTGVVRFGYRMADRAIVALEWNGEG